MCIDKIKKTPLADGANCHIVKSQVVDEQKVENLGTILQSKSSIWKNFIIRLKKKTSAALFSN
jgi:hypothetical protein